MLNIPIMLIGSIPIVDINVPIITADLQASSKSLFDITFIGAIVLVTVVVVTPFHIEK